MVSEGLNFVADSPIAETRVVGPRPKVIAHGIFNGPAPRAISRTAPSAEPPSGGAPRRRARRLTVAWPPGFRRTHFGVESISSPPCPGVWTRTRRRLVDTLRIVTSWVDCQPSPSARPNASVTGSAVTSEAEAAPRSSRPAPCAETLASGSERAVPVSRLRRSSPRRPGRAWARTAAAPATTAAAALEPLTVPNRGVPSSFAPGSEVATTTPGATRSGFTLPSKASPREENGAISPELPLRAICGTPIAIAGCSCRRIAAAARRPTRGGRLSTGTSTLSSRPRPPAGSWVP